MLMIKKQLIEKIRNKDALIAIIGLGYVGLPLALRYSEVGLQVLGLDIDQEKIAALKQGKSYIDHIAHRKIQTALMSGFTATHHFEKLKEADAIILCLPTPLSKQREPDLSYVLNTVQAMLPYIHAGQVISLESTTYPGTTDEEILPRIESTGLRVGENIFLVYSPEREDPGNVDFSTSNIPRICGGITESCLEVGVALYEQITKVIPVSSTRAAEMTKLLENIHRAVNIGLVNEIKTLTDKMGIDIYEIINAAASKPFGFVPYYPGPGIGGHCIPIDPFYLTWKAHEYGIHTRFIELAGEINSSMPQWVVHKIVDALNHHGKPIKKSKVLVLGVTYKKNVGDARESPAVKVMEHLFKKDAIVNYSDPHLPVFPRMRDHSFALSSLALTEQTLADQDAVVITTAHDLFDFNFIKTHAKLIIDTRGVYSASDPKIVKA